jgi:hypothetical protein
MSSNHENMPLLSQIGNIYKKKQHRALRNDSRRIGFLPSSRRASNDRESGSLAKSKGPLMIPVTVRRQGLF